VDRSAGVGSASAGARVTVTAAESNGGLELAAAVCLLEPSDGASASAAVGGLVSSATEPHWSAAAAALIRCARRSFGQTDDRTFIELGREREGSITADTRTNNAINNDQAFSSGLDLHSDG